MEKINKLQVQALSEINSASDLRQLDQIRVDYLGKKGRLTEQLKLLGELPIEERPKAGQIINDIKIEIQQALESRKKALAGKKLEETIKRGHIDVTMPGRGTKRAGLPPIT